MIERLRRRFVMVTMAATAIVVALLVVGINVATLLQANNETDQVLVSLMSSPDVITDKLGEGAGGAGSSGLMSDFGFDRGLSPETPFSFRYLTVTVSDSGALVSSNLTRIATVQEDDLQPFVTLVANAPQGFGDYGTYRYYVQDDGSVRKAVFLERGREVAQMRSFATASVVIGLCAIAAVYLLVRLFSLRAIDPLVQNVLEQRRFITDASHELKTPLTVIGTCLSVLELESGGSEWIDKAQNQVGEMGTLVDDLVTLSRMDEEDRPQAHEDFDAAVTVRDVVGSFEDTAAAEGHAVTLEAPESLPFKGDEYGLRKLCSILMDNALKHGAPGSPIRFTLSASGRGILLTEQNQVSDAEPLREEDLGHLFERFWRPDNARAGSSDGFGIGLALARSICDAAHGTIEARLLDDGHVVEFRCQLGR